MKKLYAITLLISFLLVPFQHIFAEEFADRDDSFIVINPSANSKVSGNVNIEWNSFDDDQTSIPYYIELFDGASCKNTSFGRINTNSSAISSKTNNNKISWDSKKTISTSTIQDGSYCLLICSAFKNSNEFYSLCNARNIRIVNNNKLPTITSTPQNLIINEVEEWQYVLKATDIDSDQLKYYLVYGPDFLEINSTTGVLKTKSNISRLTSNINIGEFRVVVGVDDGLSGTTTQEFTLRVEKGRTSNPSTPQSPVEEPQNTPSQISFTNPKENEELKGVQNFIQWSIYDPDGVKEITLSYSTDLENWNELVKSTDNQVSRYAWNVADLKDGKYYLQIKVKDNKDEIVARVSKPFYIKNTIDEPIETKPLIVNLKPENNKELTESPSTVIGEFAPAEGQQIDVESFRLSINDQIINDCIVTENGFQCSLDEQLSTGEYKIYAEIKDLNRNSGSVESNFFIKAPIIVEPPAQNNNSNIIILIITGILLLLILVVPWILIASSKRRKQQANKPSNRLEPVDPSLYNKNLQSSIPIFIPQPQTQPKIEEQVINKQSDQPKNFEDFMSTYDFNVGTNKTVSKSPIGQPKPVKQEQKENKPPITQTVKDIADRVTNFKPSIPVQPTTPSQPVSTSTNTNLSQDIQSAYSNGTSAADIGKPILNQEQFVEPSTIDTPQPAQSSTAAPNESKAVDNNPSSEYVTPTTIENGDEELKRMYPELYGASTNSMDKPTQEKPSQDSYYEPAPKD